jgi:hypothetical protein
MPPAAPRPAAIRPCRRSGGTCWPGCWPARRPGGGWNRWGPTANRLLVPPRPHHRRPARSGVGAERLRPGGPHLAASARSAPRPSRSRARRSAQEAPHTWRDRCPATRQPGRSDRIPARARDYPHLRSGRGNPAGRRQRRKDHRDEGKLTGPKGPTLKGGFRKDRRSPGAGESPRPGDNPACPETGGRGVLTCGHAPAGAKRTLSAGFGVGDANPSRQGMKFAGQGGASVGMPTGYWVGTGADTRLTSRSVVAGQTRGAPYPPDWAGPRLGHVVARAVQILVGLSSRSQVVARLASSPLVRL